MSRFFIIAFLSLSSVFAAQKIPIAVQEQIKAQLLDQDVSYSYELIFETSRLNLSDQAVVKMVKLQEQQRFELHIEDLGKSQTFYGRLETLTDVPVLKKPITPGEVITQDLIEWIQIPSNRLRASQATAVQDIVGKSAARVLQPKEILFKHDLKAPVVVTKGSTLTVVYQHGILNISIRGVALKDGALNEVIPIKRLDGQKTFEAKVLSSSKAELPVMSEEEF